MCVSTTHLTSGGISHEFYHGSGLFCHAVGTPVNGNSYATASGQILMTKLACTGNENRLVECPFQADTSAYTHSSDAGVKCFQAQR